MTKTLFVSTGHAKVDAILEGIIDVYAACFPERIRGYYLYGSYAAGDPLPSSDIDLVVLFAADFRAPDEQQRAWALSSACAALCSYELDIVPYSEMMLTQVLRTRVLLKRASICVYGTDVRPDLAWPEVTAYAREITHGLYVFLAGIRGRPPWLRFPLNYPDPTDPFYGYVRSESNPHTAQPEWSTRSLLRLIWPLAGAMITVQSGAFVGGKRDALLGYGAIFDDQWGDWLAHVWQQCREQWQYAIPTTAVEQQELRDICAQTLAFENHFLTWYRTYLLSELAHADRSARHQALHQLGIIIYPNAEIAQVLQRRANDPDPETRRIAEAVQHTMRAALQG